MKLTRRYLLALGTGISAAAGRSLSEEWRRVGGAADGTLGAAGLKPTLGRFGNPEWDRSERQCGLDRNGVEHYPPALEWTDGMINALIAKTSPAMRYRATRRYLDDPRDTGTPNGTAQLLARAFRGEVLSKSSTARLIEIPYPTTTFATRLKGLLPPGTVISPKPASTARVKATPAPRTEGRCVCHRKR